MKVFAVLVLVTLCFFSTVNDVKAAENEWLPYFIMMSSGSAPITLSPVFLLTIGLGAVMLTHLLGTVGKSEPHH